MTSCRICRCSHQPSNWWFARSPVITVTGAKSRLSHPPHSHEIHRVQNWWYYQILPQQLPKLQSLWLGKPMQTNNQVFLKVGITSLMYKLISSNLFSLSQFVDAKDYGWCWHYPTQPDGLWWPSGYISLSPESGVLRFTKGRIVEGLSHHPGRLGWGLPAVTGACTCCTLSDADDVTRTPEDDSDAKTGAKRRLEAACDSGCRGSAEIIASPAGVMRLSFEICEVKELIWVPTRHQVLCSVYVANEFFFPGHGSVPLNSHAHHGLCWAMPTVWFVAYWD